MNSIVDRRLFFKIAATGVTGYFLAPSSIFSQTVSTGNPTIIGSAKNVVFVFLPGAPSQIDTFDLKVGSWTPKTFNPTTINGIDWPGGLLPNLGTLWGQGTFGLIRSLQTTALVHPLVQTWTQIARSPTSATGSIAPNMGSVVAYEMESQRGPGQPMPGFLSLNGGGTLRGPGYFASRYAPFDVVPASSGLNLTSPDGPDAFNRRYQQLQLIDAALRGPGSPLGSQLDEMADFYTSARAMMYDDTVSAAFSFSSTDHQRYGSSTFGDACLTTFNVLSANLGVRYVQITLGGWDNHTSIYTAGGLLNVAHQLDSGLANLMSDLANTPGADGKTLLDETLIVVKGEFGRTVGPLTAQAGRDHYFVHSALVVGGGVQGGTVIGQTTPDGLYIADPGWSGGRPIIADDIAATIYSAAGIDYTKVLHDDPLGRGFEYISTVGPVIGQPIVELFYNA